MQPKRTLYTAFLLLFTSTLFAQSDCPCCDPLHRQFHFWAGDWIVYDSLGNQVGENRISLQEDNCILLEKWKSTSGNTGTSMNYYDPSDSTWNQVWVDNQGSVLKLKGQFTSGQMVLKSTLTTGPRGRTYYNQVSWTPNADGTVTQHWETYDPQGQVLRTLFLGIYHRKP